MKIITLFFVTYYYVTASFGQISKYYNNIYEAESFIVKNDFNAALLSYNKASLIKKLFIEDLGNYLEVYKNVFPENLSRQKEIVTEINKHLTINKNNHFDFYSEIDSIYIIDQKAHTFVDNANPKKWELENRKKIDSLNYILFSKRVKENPHFLKNAPPKIIRETELLILHFTHNMTKRELKNILFFNINLGYIDARNSINTFTQIETSKFGLGDDLLGITAILDSGSINDTLINGITIKANESKEIYANVSNLYIDNVNINRAKYYLPSIYHQRKMKKFLLENPSSNFYFFITKERYFFDNPLDYYNFVYRKK